MSIDYQEAIDLFVDIVKVALPLGTIWALLERLVDIYFTAVADRWCHRHE